MERDWSLHPLRLFLLVAIAGLGLANWMAAPEAWPAWAIGVATPVAITLFVQIKGARAGADTRRELAGGAFMASIIIAVSLVYSLATASAAPDDVVRILGGGVGLVIAASGNVMPKYFVPKEEECGFAPADAQRFLRQMGWITALSGLAVAGVWAIPDFETATDASLIANIVMMAAILGRLGAFFILERTKRETMR